MNDREKSESEDDQNEQKTHPADPPQSIRLDQFLQACGVPTGGQAKRLVQGGEILVNGVVETRRRKKLVLGDEVTLDGEVYVVALGEE